jgi:hypothetical protein
MAGSPANIQASAKQPSTTTREADVLAFGKFGYCCWLIAVGLAGWDVNLPKTVMRGLNEIWSGQSRTAAGWVDVIGIVLGVVLLVAWFIATNLDEKSPRGKPSAEKPQNLLKRDEAAGIENEPAILATTAQKQVEPAKLIEPIKSECPGEQAARKALQKIIADYGRDVLDDPTQCERLIRERCEAVTSSTGVPTRKEASVLVTALREDLPRRLAANGSTLSPVAVLNHAAALSQAVGLDSAAAHFAVEGWAAALSVKCSD